MTTIKQEDGVKQEAAPLPGEHVHTSTTAIIKQQDGVKQEEAVSPATTTIIKQEDGVKKEAVNPSHTKQIKHEDVIKKKASPKTKPSKRKQHVKRLKNEAQATPNATSVSSMASAIATTSTKNEKTPKHKDGNAPTNRIPIAECVENFFEGNVTAFFEFLDQERKKAGFDPHCLARQDFNLQKKGVRALVQICNVLKHGGSQHLTSSPSWIPYLREYLAPKNRWHPQNPKHR